MPVDDAAAEENDVVWPRTRGAAPMIGRSIERMLACGKHRVTDEMIVYKQNANQAATQIQRREDEVRHNL